MCKTSIQDGLHKWEFVISSISLNNPSLEKEVAVTKYSGLFF
jgi:hypothetical protein